MNSKGSQLEMGEWANLEPAAGPGPVKLPCWLPDFLCPVGRLHKIVGLFSELGKCFFPGELP